MFFDIYFVSARGTSNPSAVTLLIWLEFLVTALLAIFGFPEKRANAGVRCRQDSMTDCSQGNVTISTILIHFFLDFKIALVILEVQCDVCGLLRFKQAVP